MRVAVPRPGVALRPLRRQLHALLGVGQGPVHVLQLRPRRYGKAGGLLKKCSITKFLKNCQNKKNISKMKFSKIWGSRPPPTIHGVSGVPVRPWLRTAGGAVAVEHVVRGVEAATEGGLLPTNPGGGVSCRGQHGQTFLENGIFSSGRGAI